MICRMVIFVGAVGEMLTWDTSIAWQIEKAHDRFYELLEQGYRAFSVGSFVYQVTDFLPDFDLLVMVL